MHAPDDSPRRDEIAGILPDLPELPIPRRNDADATEQGAAPPASAGPAPHQHPIVGPAAPLPENVTPLYSAAVSHQFDPLAGEGAPADAVTWQMAAQLTAGMLANPSRGHSSVKDAVSLFDHVLQEMRTYARLVADYDLLREQEELRRASGQE